MRGHAGYCVWRVESEEWKRAAWDLLWGWAGAHIRALFNVGSTQKACLSFKLMEDSLAGVRGAALPPKRASIRQAAMKSPTDEIVLPRAVPHAARG